jgi:hypothetical protein
MGLLDKYTKISCSKYEPKSDTDKRCEHYGKGGTCKLPDELMCVEWMKLNSNKKPKEVEDGKIELEIPSDAQIDSNIKQDRPRVVIARGKGQKSTEPYVMSEEEISNLKLKGMEIRLSAQEFDEDLFIVPQATDQKDTRLELTYEETATLCTMMSIFPASKIVRVKRAKKTQE